MLLLNSTPSTVRIDGLSSAATYRSRAGQESIQGSPPGLKKVSLNSTLSMIRVEGKRTSRRSGQP